MPVHRTRCTMRDRLKHRESLAHRTPPTATTTSTAAVAVLILTALRSTQSLMILPLSKNPTSCVRSSQHNGGATATCNTRSWTPFFGAHPVVSAMGKCGRMLPVALRVRQTRCGRSVVTRCSMVDMPASVPDGRDAAAAAAARGEQDGVPPREDVSRWGD